MSSEDSMVPTFIRNELRTFVSKCNKRTQLRQNQLRTYQNKYRTTFQVINFQNKYVKENQLRGPLWFQHSKENNWGIFVEQYMKRNQFRCLRQVYISRNEFKCPQG